jgi:hypothetical protein
LLQAFPLFGSAYSIGAPAALSWSAVPAVGLLEPQVPVDGRRRDVGIGQADRSTLERRLSQRLVQEGRQRPPHDDQCRDLDRQGLGRAWSSAGEALIGPARQILRDFDSARSAISSASGLVGAAWT